MNIGSHAHLIRLMVLAPIGIAFYIHLRHEVISKDQPSGTFSWLSATEAVVTLALLDAVLSILMGTT